MRSSILCQSLGAAAIILALAAPASAAEPARVSGVVRAPERLTLRTDLAAAVAVVARREGEAFAKGDLLIEFDCTRHTADHAAAEARSNAARAEASQNEHLHALGAAGSGDVRVAAARAQAARAEAAAAAARLRDCAIYAPFAGRVADVSARAHAVPPRGEPLMELIGTAALELEMVAPSAWLRWLRAGAVLSFAVEETGAVLDGRVSRIGAEVDPLSRTVAVHAVLDASPGDGVLAGMSGLATFPDAR